MNKSNLVLGLLCITAVASLSRVAMTQEKEGVGMFDEPLANERQLPEPLDERSLPKPPINLDSNAEYQRQDDFSDPRGGSRRGGGADEPDWRLGREERMNPLRDSRFGRQPTPEQPRVSVPQVMRPRQRSRTVIETFMEAVPPEEVAENRKLQAAIKSLKTSKTESEKKKAADIISAQLKLQFERDLKKREEELAKVEERVRSLREQLDKRKAAQDDIITLRLQTLVNEANGLGFPANNFGAVPSSTFLQPYAPGEFSEPSTLFNEETYFETEPSPRDDFRGDDLLEPDFQE